MARAWTDHERQEVLRLLNTGQSYKQISKKVNRSYASVQSQIWKIKHVAPSNTGDRHQQQTIKDEHGKQEADETTANHVSTSHVAKNKFNLTPPASTVSEALDSAQQQRQPIPEQIQDAHTTNVNEENRAAKLPETNDAKSTAAYALLTVPHRKSVCKAKPRRSPFIRTISSLTFLCDNEQENKDKSNKNRSVRNAKKRKYSLENENENEYMYNTKNKRRRLNQEEIDIEHWSVDQVMQWFRSIGHAKYVEQFESEFREQSIDGKTLRVIQKDDLMALGIKKLYDRITIVRERDKLLF